MEFLSYEKTTSLVAVAISALALSSCSVDSYLTDPSNVHCDGKRTEVDMASKGMATFIVHGKHKGEVATVKVRRNDNEASVSVTGDVTGPPQQLEADGYTKPVEVADGAELSAFGAGGAWIIDIRKDSVVIEGTCDGM